MYAFINNVSLDLPEYSVEKNNENNRGKLIKGLYNG